MTHILIVYGTTDGQTRKMVKRIVEKAGSDDTDTTRDYEYTDWNDLRDFAQDFVGLMSERPVEVGGIA